MHGPDLAGIVLLLAAAGLVGQMVRLSWRWRVGGTASVDWVGGLRRLAHAYFHTVHEVVARDPYASRMHVMAAGGLVAALALAFVLHVGGMRGRAAVALASLILVSTAVSVAGVALVAWRRRPPRPRRLTGGTFNLLPAALLGALVFLCGSTVQVIRVGGSPEAFAPSSMALALLGTIALGTLVMWSVEGPMRHATAGVVNLMAHSRPRRFQGRIDSALKPLDLTGLRKPGPHLPIVGAVTPASFPWPRLAQFDACVQCGRCQEACPAYAAGQPLNPKRVIQDLVEATTAAQGGQSPLLIAEAGIGGAIAPETLWACTTCRACVHECPMLIEHVDAIVDMRRYQTLELGAVPAKAAVALETIRDTDTVAGRALGSRLDWATDLKLPIMAERRRAHVLLWLGEAAFDRRTQRTLRALVHLLRHADVDFAVLGDEERDCGDLARRLGDEFTFQDLATRNIETLERYAFDLIVTADPHAFHTLRNEYPALGGHYRVEHHSVTLDRLFADGRLRAGDGPADVVTYHDPCYLGRYNGEVAAPRRLLGRLGLTIAEMEWSGLRSRCCGGGGGASLADVPGERRIPDMRIAQARATGAAIVAVACPTCTGMLEGVIGPRPVVLDIAELALAALEAVPGAAEAVLAS
ncbi:DUF3483 domain-containing protein [Lichenifustis flavocetrariae]|uniref:(Fe-S)-binding protein n=1 Tax=Lichenifustis flavocetrariae TaxID=2949735 RepID=A0AA41YZ38_9HYPH|nr:DUF3483 domain-containing protein [Lichenifustis flavocetrariae]MCW6511241.1 (Fe-S)-binding protein [Lichenifustis flavocetrariae]